LNLAREHGASGHAPTPEKVRDECNKQYYHSHDGNHDRAQAETFLAGGISTYEMLTRKLLTKILVYCQKLENGAP
jgi:hypothetical protein